MCFGAELLNQPEPGDHTAGFVGQEGKDFKRLVVEGTELFTVDVDHSDHDSVVLHWYRHFGADA